MNYVFYMFAQWLFTYLVEEREFSLLESGLLYALPFATGAALAAAGGLTCDALCRRIGPRWGCRLPAMTGLVLVAVFLLAGAYAVNPYAAVVMLSLCFGFTQFTEGSFWSATTYVAGPYTATATGVLNTGGNAAGFLAPVVGLLVDRLGWIATLASGSAFAIAGAASVAAYSCGSGASEQKRRAPAAAGARLGSTRCYYWSSSASGLVRRRDGLAALQDVNSAALTYPSPSPSAVLKSRLSVDCERTSAADSLPSPFASRSLKPLFIVVVRICAHGHGRDDESKQSPFHESLLSPAGRAPPW